MSYFDYVAGSWFTLPNGWTQTQAGLRSPEGIEFWITGPSGRWFIAGEKRSTRGGRRFYRSILSASLAAGVADENLPIER